MIEKETPKIPASRRPLPPARHLFPSKGSPRRFGARPGWMNPESGESAESSVVGDCAILPGLVVDSLWADDLPRQQHQRDGKDCAGVLVDDRPSDRRSGDSVVHGMLSLKLPAPASPSQGSAARDWQSTAERGNTSGARGTYLLTGRLAPDPLLGW